MNLGAIIDKLIFFTFGIYCIFLSVRKKKILGDKVTLVRFCGIIFIALGIIFSLISIF